MKLFVGILPFYKIRQSFYGQGWVIWCHSKFYHIPFFSLTDCEWLYNIQLKTRGGALLPPSDAYVRSFLYLLYTLIKRYYTKALSDPASSLAPDWICLLRRPRILESYHSATTFQLELLAVQRSLKSILQYHSSKASILQRSVFFIVQLLHPYMATG